MDTPFFTSDLHFGHKNILKFNPSTRPFSDMNEMNSSIIQDIHAVVGADGTLIQLGDFSFLNYQQTVSVLSRIVDGIRRIEMMYGNHCSPRRIQDACQEVNDAHGREACVILGDYDERKIEGLDVVLSHYPMRDWNKAHYGSIQLHGHMHGALKPLGRSVDVGWDSTWINGVGGRIHSWADIRAWAEKQSPIEMGYHKRKDV